MPLDSRHLTKMEISGLLWLAVGEKVLVHAGAL
jgi:hypothetical protein